MSSLKDVLKRILVRDKLIAPEDLQKALDEQKLMGGDLGKILIKRKLIDEDVLVQVLSEGLGPALFNLFGSNSPRLASF